MKIKAAPAPLHQYVEHLAALMGLGDWDFEVTIADLDSKKSGNLAQISAPSSNRIGYIAIDRRWRKWEPSKLREVVTHELMHAHLEHFCWGADHLYEILPKKAFELFIAQQRGVGELVTDRVSTSWAKSLPLFEEVTGG